MIRSPAHFERFPARRREGGPPRRAKSRAPPPLAGGASSLPPGLRSTPAVTQLGGLGLGRTRKMRVHGRARGTEGTAEIHRSGAGGLSATARPLPRPRRATFPGGVGRRLRHFILIIVSVDTCSS